MKLAPFYNSFTQRYDSKALHKILKKMIMVCVVMESVYGLATTHIRFVLNATPSIPYTLFIVLKRTRPSVTLPPKDRYVVFDHAVVQTRVIKQVKGLPGEKLWYDKEDQLWIDDFCVGKPHTHTRRGKHVNKIQSHIIPEGYVFVYASHDRSFDSRYEEFGLIPVQSIQGVGVAVL